MLLAPSLVRPVHRRLVWGVVVAVVVCRLAYVVGPLRPDEAGYLMVARAWHLGGPNLYGHYFVDRPPLLIGLFALASLVPWDPFIRVLTVPFAVLFVLSAAWAVRGLVGARGGVWAALVAGALISTPALNGQEADGEVFAAPLVMLAVALTLAAVRRRGAPALATAFAAGFTGALAVMAKQNFVDAFVFAAVLLVVGALQHRIPLGEAVRVALGGLAGGAVVLAGLVGYVLASGISLGRAYFTLFGFRGIALDVITDHNLHAPMLRAVELLGLAVLCGAAPIMVLLARQVWHSEFSGPPVAWAVGVTMAVEVLGIAAGGNYWPHYLLQLAPMLALAVGVWGPQLRWLRAASVFTVASAVVITVALLFSGRGLGYVGPDLGRWVAASARPGDTATVLYGDADIQEASGLPSPYPHLWTLPMRTMDPHLRHLRALLRSPRAPTWVVVWLGLDAWRIDPHDTTRLDLVTHYRMVRRVCGHQVWLHDGQTRVLAPKPRC
jgi:hypothetical protein